MWKLVKEFVPNPAIDPKAMDLVVLDLTGFYFDNLFRMGIRSAESKYHKLEIDYETKDGRDNYTEVRIYSFVKGEERNPLALRLECAESTCFDIAELFEYDIESRKNKEFTGDKLVDLVKALKERADKCQS